MTRARPSGADLVVTDTWISMGQEEEKGAPRKAFAGYRVDPRNDGPGGSRRPVPALPAGISRRKSPMRSSTPRQCCLGRGRESDARSKALLEFLLC